MRLVHCENCGTKIQPHERRVGSVPTTYAEPGYDFDGCILCAPSESDIERWRNAADEAAFERARTEDMEAW